MKPADAVLVTVAVMLIAMLYINFWTPGRRAEQAQIRTPYQNLQVSLQQDRDIAVKGKMGISRLRVRHGKIRFIDSPCPGKYCIHSGWLKRSGEFTACLPNGISLMISGADARFDAINF